MKFTATVIPSGNATGVEVPADVVKTLGAEARPPVVIAIHGHSWRSRVARMRGQCLIGISAANRAAAGIVEGEIIEIDLRRDDEPREVELPLDIADALDRAAARTAFDGLPFGLRRKHVADIEGTRGSDTRLRRVQRLVDGLTSK